MDNTTIALLHTQRAALLAIVAACPLSEKVRAALLGYLAAIEDDLKIPRSYPSRQERRLTKAVQ